MLLYLGAVPSALAYALFFTGLRTVPGAVASIVTLLEPLTATALATAFLGERLSPGRAGRGPARAGRRGGAVPAEDGRFELPRV